MFLSRAEKNKQKKTQPLVKYCVLLLRFSNVLYDNVFFFLSRDYKKTTKKHMPLSCRIFLTHPKQNILETRGKAL